jgi:hypothetical protein
MIHTKMENRNHCYLLRPLSKLIWFAAAAVSFVSASHRLEAESAELASTLYRDAASSVFVISIRDSRGAPISFDTGFVIGKNTLATNLHVVEGGDVFLEQGGVRIPASIQKRDPLNDLV